MIRKQYLLCGLTLLGVVHVQAWDFTSWQEVESYRYTVPVLAGVTIVSTSFALYHQYFRKRQSKDLKEQLARQKKQNQELIIKIKNEIAQVKGDEEFIAQVAHALDLVDTHYGTELSYLSLEAQGLLGNVAHNFNNKPQARDIRLDVQWKKILAPFRGSLNTYEEALTEMLGYLSKLKGDLEGRKKEWGTRKCLLKDGQDFLVDLTMAIELLSRWCSLLQAWKLEHKEAFLHLEKELQEAQA